MTLHGFVSFLLYELLWHKYGHVCELDSMEQMCFWVFFELKKTRMEITGLNFEEKERKNMDEKESQCMDKKM